MQFLVTRCSPRLSWYQIIPVILSIFLVHERAMAQLPPDYSHAPVLFVHGSGLSSSTWNAMINDFANRGYPREYLSAIDLIPNDGANVRAAEMFIAPAAESLLVRAERAARRAGYTALAPQRLDILGHSMGGLSSRWYAARLRPDRVRIWISLAGANHGTNALCGFSGDGNIEMCPAFGTDPVQNAIQVELNGTPISPLDETPYGIGVDRQGIPRVSPDVTRRILYYSIRIEPDDFIKPESSAIIDGAGGVPILVPSGVPVTETNPGNYLFTGATDHDALPANPDLIRFVVALLSTSISINDVTVTEGNTGTTNAVFTVTLSAASSQTVTVDYATAEGTATAGSDYVAGSGTLTFAPGMTTQTITVVVNGDLLDEPDETFFVNLSNPTNATIADNQGVGTITDDDPAPTISINDVTVTEGNTGTVNAVFNVTLSAASGQTVTVDYATANGTATAGSDYVAGSGTLTFAPGTRTQTITILVTGDVIDEPREKFFVNLSNPINATIADGQGVCTITDDEGQPVHFLTVLDGAQQAPPVKAKTSGGGMFTLALTQDTLNFNLRVQSLSGPIISAHFANAAAGANGPVVRTITSNFNAEAASGIWTSTDSESLTPELVTELLAGRIYVSIRTSAFPNGEIRGQLLTNTPINLFAAFSGSQEVPLVTTRANGTGNLTLSGDGKNLAFDINVNGLSGPITAAHFHLAAPGRNGPIVRDISGNFTANKGSGIWFASDASPLNSSRVAELLAGTIYVNIHTAANPDGEIRGQIGRQALPDWLVPVTVRAIGNQNSALPVTSSFDLAFGDHAAAKDGFDLGLDSPSAPAGFIYFAYFASKQFPNFFTRDIRAWAPPFEDEILWAMQIVNAAEITSEVRWDSTALPPQDSFTLSGPGIEVDMRTRGSARVMGNAILTIRKHLPRTCVTYDFPLAEGGWYLISLPVEPRNNSAANLFPTATAVFGWNMANQAYVPASALEPQRAYWILMPSAARVEVCGIPVPNYSRSYTAQGWDLVGSVMKSSPLVDDPKGSVVDMFRWNPATQSHARTHPRQVEPKEGYWILVFGVPSKIVVGGTGAFGVDTAKSSADLTAFYEKYGALPPMPPLPVAVETPTLLPETYGLSQNYPNPFNPETVIEYRMPKPGRVSLKIYTILGAEVRTLIDDEMPAGFHRVRWDGTNDAGQRINSGIYLYKIRADEFVQVKKLVLVK